MSAWRAKAIEMFPALKSDIEVAENPYDLWFTLFFMFKSSIVNEDYNEALRVSEYAN